MDLFIYSTNILSILSVILMIISLYILFSHNMLINIISMGIFSLMIMLIYLFMDAPDVAMTEASIGACVSTVMLFLGYRKLSDNNHDFKSEQIKFTDILSFCVCFSIFLIAVSKMQNIFYPYGLSETLLHTRLSDVYVSATNANIEILSPVASILASFRGFDTLGETFVILCAAMGVLLIMSL